MADLVPVAVFDANQPPAIAMTRSLGRAGVPVHVYSHEALSAAGVSRFAARQARCPDPSDAGRFLPWLEGRLRAGEIGLVAPTSDLVAFYVSELRHLFAEDLRRGIPAAVSAHAALFKDRFADALSRRGVDMPRTEFPSSVHEAVALARALHFPLVIKPRSHVAIGWARGHVVHDAGELARSYAPYPIGASYGALLERHPELRWPMLQEYVPGALENTFSVSGLLAHDGRLLAASASRKLRQWPPDLGVGVVFESVAGDELVASGARVARHVLGAGLFEVELIFDRASGRYLAIDLNPRAFGQITLDIARGIDLPSLWYESFFRADIPPVAPARSDVRWRHFWPFHVGQLAAIVTGPGRGRKLADYARQVSEPHVDIANDWVDPLPNVVFALHLWRHPGGLVRPFLYGAGIRRGPA